VERKDKVFRRTAKFTIMAAAVVVAALFVPARAADDSSAIAAARSVSHAFTVVAEKAIPAVVFIRAEQAHQTAMSPEARAPWDFFGHGLPFQFEMPTPPQGRRIGQGSGFLISPDGLILTNNHVVEGATRLDVRLSDGREFKGKVVGKDAPSDLAVVRIDGEGLPFLELADSDAVQIGEWVLAVGSPFGLSNTVTSGIVSAKGRSRVGITGHEDFIQTDAAINPGNSGGPLLNLDGKVVGINSAILSRSGGNNGVGFAIPSNLARTIEDQLVKTGHIVRGFLGVVVQDLTPDLASEFGAKGHTGALVSEVSGDTPAASAGIRQGDVITAVNGKAVTNPGELRNRVAIIPPGTKVDLTVIRDGAEQHVSATLAERPGDETSAAAEEQATTAFGVEVAPLTPDLAARLDYGDTKGVLVRAVVSGGAAERAGLEPGQLIVSVDRKPVTSVAEFEAAVAKAKDGRILLQVRDGPHSRYVILSED